MVATGLACEGYVVPVGHGDGADPDLPVSVYREVVARVLVLELVRRGVGVTAHTHRRSHYRSGLGVLGHLPVV